MNTPFIDSITVKPVLAIANEAEKMRRKKVISDRETITIAKYHWALQNIFRS